MAIYSPKKTRLVKKPKFRIAPKYDLPFFRYRKFSNSKKETNVVLPLTSMIDMFSMLVIFLILNFSATGEVFFINKNLMLPQTNNAKPLKGLPLITITKNSVILDAEKVGKNPVHIEETDNFLPKLRLVLQRMKALEKMYFPNREFKGRVNLQVDQGLPVVYVKRVMNTLINEGWTEINFATQPLAK